MTKVGAARAIILDNGKILVMHRIRHGDEYYILPGGKLEDGETPEECAIREVKEETGLTITLDRHVWNITHLVHGQKRDAAYFSVKTFSGRLELGEPERSEQSEDNQFLLEWLELDVVLKGKLYPEEMKEKLRHYMQRKR